MLRYRFCLSSRLRDASDFQRVFTETSFRFTRGPLVLLARRTEIGAPRLGLVMRKKNLRQAVQRNLMKRLIRENFRLRQQDLPSVDLVFMSRSTLAGMSRSQLHQNIGWLLDKVATSDD